MGATGLEDLSSGDGSTGSAEFALKTLLVSDLVDSTALVERIGDARAAEVFRQRDRVARDLLREHGGQEIDKTDGFLMLFERPVEAVLYSFAYHRALRRLSAELDLVLATRIGIHVGEVQIVPNTAEDIARGAKPIEVEGLAKPFAARVMSVAIGGQTLLTRTAFDLARRSTVGQIDNERLRWISHGPYSLKGVDEPVEICEVGIEGESPLRAPEDSEKVKRLSVSEGQGSAPSAVVSSEPELVGTVLGGFRIVRRIGAGGMGVVYEAVEESLNRTVALKVLPAELTLDPKRRTRFLSEARSAAAVTHPCVATVYQVGTAGNRVYIAIELVRGMTLRHRISEGPMPVEEALHVAVEIARGLASAHEAGVIHRDLKPDNVMLSKDGQVKLLDFGLAKQLNLKSAELAWSEAGHDLEPSVEGRILGTPGYMSPEQGRGTAVDARADVFSFGILLYEMLAGLRPFRGDSALDTLIATSRDEHRPLREHRPDVPEPLLALVDRCLAKSPEQRYASASELLERLRELKGGAPAAHWSLGEKTNAQAMTSSDSSERSTAKLSSSATSAVGATSLLTPEPSALPAQRAKRGWVLGLVVAVACVAITASFVRWFPRDAAPGSSTASAASPLVAEDSVLACPLLEAKGVESPSGWLGAATAHLACERATIMLGGRTKRTLIPAQLLDLPAELTDDHPRDPYCAPDARDKSITAARERASCWLDGAVESKRDGFDVRLRFMTKEGIELAAGAGTGRALFQAVRAAFEGLVESGALPLAPQIEESVARWTGIEDRDLALAAFDWEASCYGAVGTREGFAALEARRAELGPLWPLIRFRSAQLLSLPVEKLDSVALDTSSPERHMLTAAALSVTDPAADRAALADQMAALREKSTEPIARASLANVEVNLRYQLSENERVGQLALSVANDDARRTEWSFVTASTYRKKGFEHAARAVAAWEPTNPDGWNMLGYGEPDASNEQRLRMFRRAVDLAPELPLWSLNYTRQLVSAGQPARARSIAARLSAGGPEQRAASETILAMLDCSNARLLAASTRTRKALTALDRFGSIEMADAHLLPIALYVEAILGREQELADAFAERFVMPEPTRLGQGHFALLLATNACAVASRPTALKCFERLRSLATDNWFVEGQVSTTDALVDAAERYVKGDIPGAVAAWRSLVASGSTLPDYASVALDEAGESELAAQNDAKKLGAAPSYHGATLAHVREARRAAARRDTDRARNLATAVVDAWSTADTKVAAVDEMRKLLSTLPQAKR